MRNMMEKLKRLQDSRVRITFSDGEILIADIDLVLKDEAAVTLDLVSSNRPEKYAHLQEPRHIFAKVAGIVSCDPAPSR